MDTTTAKGGTPGDKSPRIGFPYDSLAEEWLMLNSGETLGRSNFVIGESGSGKSSYLFDRFRVYLSSTADAVADYNLTEARDQRELRLSQVGADIDDRVHVRRCPSLEQWQRHLTKSAQLFRSEYGRPKSRGPTGFLISSVDSVTGVTSEKVIEGIEEVGHATLTHAIDANILTTYLKYIPNQVSLWPWIFTAVCHIKYDIEKRGLYTVKVPRIPGGDTVRYHATSILLFKRIGAVEREDCDGGNKIVVKTFKNSLGIRDRELEVEMLWWFENGVQTTRWDWNTATTRLLLKHIRKDQPDLEDIVSFPIVHDQARACSCPKVGIRKPAPFAEIGAAINADATLRAEIRKFYGIHEVVPYRPDVPWFTQIEEAVAAGKTAEQPRNEDAPVSDGEVVDALPGSAYAEGT